MDTFIKLSIIIYIKYIIYIINRKINILFNFI